MPKQSTIFQCVPTDDDSDDGLAESKIDTNSTSSSSLIDYNTIKYDGSKNSCSSNNKRSNITRNTIRHYTVQLAAIGQQGMQAGCQSAAAAAVDDTFCKSVDNVFESAVDMLMPSITCITGDLTTKSKKVANEHQDDHTVEVDYNGSLHTIVSSSSKGKYDEIILVPDKEPTQRAKRFGRMGRLFRPKRDPEKKDPVHRPTTPAVSPSPTPVATPTRQRAVTTVSLLDECQQQNTSRRDANNGAVALRSFSDQPQHLQPQQPKQQRHARALKSKAVNQVACATNEKEKQPSLSSLWCKSVKKQLSKEQSASGTERYVHQQEEAIQEGDTSVLMIRMYRTPTNCMVPQKR
jgi:hypothetical protein